MAIVSEPDAPHHGIAYGRRRQIPCLLVGAALAAFFALNTRYQLTRILESALIIWIAFRVYRFWTVPMTPRFAERLERRRVQKANEVPFGKKLWHKFAIGFIVLIALFLAALIIGSALTGT
jgi:hypothetical protein